MTRSLPADVVQRLRAQRDDIERSAMFDQLGWKRRLDAASDQIRKRALQILLQPPIFERWCVVTDVLKSSDQ